MGCPVLAASYILVLYRGVLSGVDSIYLSQQKLVLVHVCIYSACQLVCVCVQVCMHAYVRVCVCVPCLVASQAHQGTCVEDVRVVSL